MGSVIMIARTHNAQENKKLRRKSKTVVFRKINSSEVRQLRSKLKREGYMVL